MAKNTPRLTQRERIALRLFLWLITIIEPWEYSHEQKEWLEGLKKDLEAE